MSSFVQQIQESNTIAVDRRAVDWEEAVRLGGRLMVDAQLVESRYIDAIVRNHREIGPYFIIAPGIAMPHARPENGVLSTGYALVTLSEPVEFGDEENDPVDILIFAGATDRERHNQEVIPQIAELCDSEDVIDALRNARDVAAVRSILTEFERALEMGESDR